MWKNLARITRGYSTVDKQEVRHFEKFLDNWWDEHGDMRALHALNKLRVPLIRDGLLNVSKEVPRETVSLKGFTIVDVGCGAGILAEPLARIGASVSGVDANSEIIERAKFRINDKNLSLEYFCGSIEEFACANKEKHDALVASEVLEHVSKKEEFLKSCVQCLKPGGSIFVTTISQTNFANVCGILFAENVFRLVPKGTHQYEKFIKPHRLEQILEDLNCKTILVQGMFYNFLKNEWGWCCDHRINYALHATKLKC